MQRKACGTRSGYHIAMISGVRHMNIALSLVLVFASLLLAELAAQALLVAASDLPDPAQSPILHLPGLALTRFGMATAFVGLWLMVRYDQVERIWTFVLFWWVMLALYEIGQAVGPTYGWTDAVSGLISASVSLPLAGLVVSRLLRA